MLDKAYTDATKTVEPTTQSVAMVKQVEYAVGRMALRARISIGTIYDAKGKAVNVSNGFTLKVYGEKPAETLHHAEVVPRRRQELGNETARRGGGPQGGNGVVGGAVVADEKAEGAAGLLPQRENEFADETLPVAGRTQDVDPGRLSRNGLFRRAGERALWLRDGHRHSMSNHQLRFQYEGRGDEWRDRVIPIFFDRHIPDERRELGLVDRLIQEEGPGIFNWFLEGARRGPTSCARASRTCA